MKEPLLPRYTTKLYRLTCSDRDAHEIADHLAERKIRLSIGVSVHDPNDLTGKLLFNALAMIAEFEADLIRSRPCEGMKVAKVKGRLCGKQPKLAAKQEGHLDKPTQHGTAARIGDI